jgi:hypothetical protein
MTPTEAMMTTITTRRTLKQEVATLFVASALTPAAFPTAHSDDQTSLGRGSVTAIWVTLGKVRHSSR